MSVTPAVLDAESLLPRVAAQIPEALRAHVVIIGSVAVAWSFRDVLGTASVATKDVDLLLRPGVVAVSTAAALGEHLLKAGWTPQFPFGRTVGSPSSADDELPAMRLLPPRGESGWFVELLSSPSGAQSLRREWHRFATTYGVFGLPSFRFMPVAVHGAEPTTSGLTVASPACMALAHLLEHAQPDQTPIAGLPGNPPRFVKDVGRAVAIWWLANQQSTAAPQDWRVRWDAALHDVRLGAREELLSGAGDGLHALDEYLAQAHQLALNSVLAAHGTTLDAFRRAHRGLSDFIRSL